MPFFEWKQELYSILCLIVNPIVCCTIFFLVRPKRIWFSPLVILCVFWIITAIFFPYLIKDLFGTDYDFTTIYWLIFFSPFQIVSALFFTGITYIIIKMRSR